MIFNLENGKVSVDKLAACMSALVNDRALYQQLKDATVCAQQKFDIDIVAERYLELYRRIMKDKL